MYINCQESGLTAVDNERWIWGEDKYTDQDRNGSI